MCWHIAGLAVTFFEIGGILGSFLAGVITDNWIKKVKLMLELMV